MLSSATVYIPMTRRYHYTQTLLNSAHTLVNIQCTSERRKEPCLELVGNFSKAFQSDGLEIGIVVESGRSGEIAPWNCSN